MNTQAVLEMKRYELPTCLLEVWAERSPLSAWADQPLVSSLKFRLQIAQRIVKGNQKQLEKMVEAVTTYVDNFLAGDQVSSLQHTLVIPKPSRTKTKLQLNTLQLFDLLTSLEQCTSELVILPTLELEVKRINPAWLKIAALLVATVGITTAAIKLTTSPMTSQIVLSEKVQRSQEDSAQPRASISKAIPSPQTEKPLKPPSAIESLPTENSQAPLTDSQTIDQPTLKSSKQPAIASAKVPPITSNELSPPDPTTQNYKTSPNSSPVLEETKEHSVPPNVSSKDELRANRDERNPDKLASDRNSINSPTPSVASSAPRGSISPEPDLSISPIQQPERQTPSGRLRRQNESSSSIIDRMDTSTMVQVIRVETAIPKDVTNSLTQYLQSLKLLKPVNTEIKLEIILQQGKVEEIRFDESVAELQDSGAQELLKQSLLKWKAPQSVSGNVTVTLRLLSP